MLEKAFKKDAMSLVTGKPVYTDDLAPKDCLVVKVLHSPHAFAKIKSINTTIAKKFQVLKTYLHMKMCLRQDLLWPVNPIQNSVLMIVIF